MRLIYPNSHRTPVPTKFDFWYDNQYDSGGRLIQVVTPAGAITKYTYDADDEMLTITDPDGNLALVNQYDSQGRVVHQTTPLGGQVSFSYSDISDNGGLLPTAIPGQPAIPTAQTQVTVTDGRGIRRVLSYSSNGYFTAGQLLADVRAVGAPEQAVYTYSWQSATNLLQSVTDPLGRTTSYAYDAAGNMTSRTILAGTANAATVSATYEPTFHQLASVSDALGRTVNYGYDSSGNLVSITSPLTNAVVNQYNTQGQLTSSSITGGPSVTVAYAGGLPSSIQDGLGNSYSTVRDGVGRMTSASDPLGSNTQYSYDQDNRLLAVVNPLLNKSQVSYDANGNPLTVQDARGGTITYTYDADNRVKTRSDALGAATQIVYDNDSNVASVTDRKNQATAYTYDSLNRPSRITYADGSTTTLTYDGASRLTQSVDSATGTRTFSYDPLDRLTSTTTPLGSVSYAYNTAGQRTTMTVAGQSAVNYSYDAAGRLSQISQGSATTTIAYDSVGRRHSVALPNGVSMTYQYDGASRLSEIDYANTAGPLGAITYQYDAAGRKIAIGGGLASTRLPSAWSGAVYNAANELTQLNGATLTYDANGNLTNDGVSTYTWNARNKLASISGGSSASFTYDWAGSRIFSQVNSLQKQFLMDGPNVVQELGGTGSVTANYSLGLGVDESYARTDMSGSHFRITDGLNSTVGLTDSSGNLATRYSYDPFGSVASSGTASSNNTEFTGREDDGNGLYYLRARYYSPALARFISQDPIGERGGLNSYAYANENPVSLTDPLGLDPNKPTNNQDKEMRCLSQAISDNEVSFYLDAISLIPLVGTAGVVVKLGLGLTSMTNSNDLTGVSLGASGTYVSAIDLFQAGGLIFGKAVPLLGTGIGIASLGNDLLGAQKEYKSCMGPGN